MRHAGGLRRRELPGMLVGLSVLGGERAAGRPLPPRPAARWGPDRLTAVRRAGGNGRRLRWPSEAVGRAGSPVGGHARDAWPYGRVWVLCGGLPLVYSAQQRQKPQRQQQQPQGQRQHPKGGGAPQRGGAPAPPTASEASTTPPTRPTAAIGAPPTPGAAMARSAGATATQGRIATPAGRAAAPAAPPTPRVGARPPEPAAPGR